MEFILLMAVTVEVSVFALLSYSHYSASIFWLLLAPNYILLLKNNKLKQFFIVIIVLTIISIPIVNYTLELDSLPLVTKQGFDIITIITALFLLLINYLLINEYIHIYTKENNELSHKNDELREIQKALIESQNFQERFFANVSHELRTPLSTITGLSDILKNEKSNSEIAESLSEASQSLSLLINDLLEFNNIKEGNISFDKVPFSLEESLSKISQMMNFQFKQKNINFILQLSDRCPKKIIADSKRLNQILINIIGNNIRMAENGSVKLKVIPTKIENQSIGLRFEVLFHFSDYQPKYYQNNLNNNHNNNYDSNNQPIIDLDLTEKLVQSKNGKLDIQKMAPNHFQYNLSFRFNIPKPSEPEKKDQPTQTPIFMNDQALAPLKILIVDDNKINLTIAKKQLLLHSPNLEIETKDNGWEALELVNKEPFDTILLDVRMPSISGIEVAQKIRAKLGPNQDTPIIALTADVTEKTTQECEGVGMDKVLSKPYDVNQLLQIISQLSPYEK